MRQLIKYGLPLVSAISICCGEGTSAEKQGPPESAPLANAALAEAQPATSTNVMQVQERTLATGQAPLAQAQGGITNYELPPLGAIKGDGDYVITAQSAAVVQKMLFDELNPVHEQSALSARAASLLLDYDIDKTSQILGMLQRNHEIPPGTFGNQTVLRPVEPRYRVYKVLFEATMDGMSLCHAQAYEALGGTREKSPGEGNVLRHMRQELGRGLCQSSLRRVTAALLASMAQDEIDDQRQLVSIFRLTEGIRDNPVGPEREEFLRKLGGTTQWFAGWWERERFRVLRARRVRLDIPLHDPDALLFHLAAAGLVLYRQALAEVFGKLITNEQDLYAALNRRFMTSFDVVTLQKYVAVIAVQGARAK